MPNSVERALADSLSLEHPDVPWQLPAALPVLADLKAGIATLEAQAAPVQQKHATWCLAKLVLAFEPNTKLTGEETRLRLNVWLEANADLGDALWSEATLAAIQSLKWMPKPAEFRGLVEAKLAARAKRMKRCQAMLAAHGQGQAPEEKPIETRLGRMEHTRSIYARMNRHTDVARIDREIAIETGQPVPDLAIDLPDAPERPPFKPNTSHTGLRCAELAEAQRQGRAPKPTPGYAGEAPTIALGSETTGTLPSDPVDFESQELV